MPSNWCFVGWWWFGGLASTGEILALKQLPSKRWFGFVVWRCFGLVSHFHKNQGFKSPNHQSKPPITGYLTGTPRQASNLWMRRLLQAQGTTLTYTTAYKAMPGNSAYTCPPPANKKSGIPNCPEHSETPRILRNPSEASGTLPASNSPKPYPAASVCCGKKQCLYGRQKETCRLQELSGLGRPIQHTFLEKRSN